MPLWSMECSIIAFCQICSLIQRARTEIWTRAISTYSFQTACHRCCRSLGTMLLWISRWMEPVEFNLACSTNISSFVKTPKAPILLRCFSRWKFCQLSRGNNLQRKKFIKSFSLAGERRRRSRKSKNIFFHDRLKPSVRNFDPDWIQ